MQRMQQVKKDLLIRSFVLELAVEANLLTRSDVECFCSKLHVWLREEFNDDYAKMWDAFKQGRRPM